MDLKLALSLDDVLLVPQYSEVISRKDVDLSTDLGRGVVLRIPIISSNMLHCTGTKMALEIDKLGGLAVLHRFKSYNEIINDCNTFSFFNKNVVISVGVKSYDYEFVDSLSKLGCGKYCVDVAHGDHILCIDMVKYIRSKSPDALIIAGNVATGKGALRLYKAGADVIKANVGSGSVCLTRIEAGNGVPSITALEDCYNASISNSGSRLFRIIADGGIRTGGDIIKSLVFSDAVMLGNLLAASDESPGDIVEINGTSYKEYAGSSTLKNTNIEGVAGYVKCKGPVAKIIKSLLEGVASGCSYQGARNIDELKGAEFVRVTNSGLIESHAHDIMLKK